MNATGGRLLIGVCAGPSGRYETICLPALRALGNRDGTELDVVVVRNAPSIAAAYNQILDEAATRSDLAGVVFVHDDVELRGQRAIDALVAALGAPEAGIVGVIGASGPGGMAWFSRPVKVGAVVEPHNTYTYEQRSGLVDVIDGLLIGFTPWAVANLRFDEVRYRPFHGYDADICAQALDAGRTVAVIELDVVHHTAGAFGSAESYRDWVASNHAWRLRWQTTKPVQRAVLQARLTLVDLELRLRPSMRRRIRRLHSPTPWQARTDDPNTPLAQLPITVVIPARNAAATLAAQLQALQDQGGVADAPCPPFSIIVVDNDSSDATAAVASAFDAAPRPVYVVHEPVAGINSARNAGIAQAVARHHPGDGIVALCDADDVVRPDWLASMIVGLQPDSWVGGVLDYATLNDEHTRRMWGVTTRSATPTPRPFVDTGFGGNCAFTLSMWHHVGGFDATLSGAGDENEFFVRAWSYGYRLRWAPRAVVAVHLRTGTGTMIRQRYRKGIAVAAMNRTTGGRLAPGEPRRTALKTWLWLALSAPGIVRAKHRLRWLRVGAYRVGLLRARLRF